MEAGTRATLFAFLDRIGLSDEAEALIAREPNSKDLSSLLHAFLLSVPFENLGQHTHPAADGGVAAVAAGKHIPSLEVHKTLKKVVYDRRGGFCFELNFAFAWLLRSLGYKVRLSLSSVITPGGLAPGHLALFVDGLGPHPLHVDPGFGDAPREAMPTTLLNTVTDSMIGDVYHFAANDAAAFGNTPETAKRYGQVLYRSRKTGFASSVMVDFAGLPETPPPTEMTPPEPVYLVNFEDDLALDCDEFVSGIAGVLADHEMNPFSQKRMCIMMRREGFDFVGQDYMKEMRHGKEVRREALKDEAAYRSALKQVAGITLT